MRFAEQSGSRLRRGGLALAAAGIMVVAAGCGGSSNGGLRSSKSSPTSTAAAGVGSSSQSSQPFHIAEGVRLYDASATTQSSFQRTVSVRPGDVVQIQTRLVEPMPRSARLDVSLPKGPATKLVVRSSGPDVVKPRVATLRSADGAAIGLSLARYTCIIGPATFCDGATSTETSSAFKLTVHQLRPKVPVVVAATVVGPAGAGG